MTTILIRRAPLLGKLAGGCALATVLLLSQRPALSAEDAVAIAAPERLSPWCTTLPSGEVLLL